MCKMGLKAAVQALKKAEELKVKVSRHNDLLNNSEVWSDHQQLQTIYYQVLVLDLEYALDKKVEQELWNLGFKNHIATLQHSSRDKKNPRRSECQSLLNWCLESASGFYLTLLQELCSTFELDLQFRRRGPQNSNISLTQPQKTSCLYICQYCLVHLGDIARYRSQRKQAESFYRHAILLSPSSGHPYNQLALLEASRGDKLSTVFHYIRSIALKNPFPVAATNLNKTLQILNPIKIHSKLLPQEYISLFLHVHSNLQVAANLAETRLAVKSLNANLTALVATKTFQPTKLIQMTAINLYALNYATGGKVLSNEEARVKGLAVDLLAGAFSAYLLPIYTMGVDESLLEYSALPAIKLTMDWIKTDPTVLKESVFTERLQIWPSLCKLLNSLQDLLTDVDVKNSDKIPLAEDKEMQCFLPLVNAFKDLDFASENLNQDETFLNKLRVNRLVHLGVWLATQTVDNSVLITAKKEKNPNRVVFEPSNKQPDPTTELLEELKHFTVKEVIVSNEPKKEKVRSGILKPQGSLEKCREERERELNVNTNTNSVISSAVIRSTFETDCSTSGKKRGRQNVAMQALAAKKLEENNNKQVTFLTTNPTINPILNTMETVKIPEMSNNGPIPRQHQEMSNNGPIPLPHQTQNFPRTQFPIQNYLQAQAQRPYVPQQVHVQVQPSYNQTNKDQFGQWLRDEKLPMPPSNWWTNNQKNLPRSFVSGGSDTSGLFDQSGRFGQAGPSRQSGGYENSGGYEKSGHSEQFGLIGTLGQSQPPDFFPPPQNYSFYNAVGENSCNNSWNANVHQLLMNQSKENFSVSSSPGYSLFNSNWAPNLTNLAPVKSPERPPLMRQQSYFSGPSPLERLLEQQKQQRGNNKEDT